MYFHFRVWSLTGERDISKKEFDIIQNSIKRMQNQVNRVLGPDEGLVYTSELNGHMAFTLRVTIDTAGSDEVRSLIGWIELFALEEAPQLDHVVNLGFPLGNPGFAP